MRTMFALLASLAGCAATPTRQVRYDALLAESRHEDRAGAVTRVRAAVALPALDRRALIEATLAVNREVETARQAYRAALSAVPVASAFEDPRARYAITPLAIGSAAPFGHRLELSQRLPYPGKRAAATDVALAEAEVMRADLQAIRLMVAELASQLFDDAFATARALEINDQHRRLLDQLRAVADARLASGRGSTQDSIQVEVELGMLERERLRLETERIAITARINGLLHRDPGAPLPAPPATVGVPADPPAVATFERAAIDARPHRARAEAVLGGAEASVRGAERAYYPDVELMASYDTMWDMPEHRWMLGVAIEVPLQRGKRGAAVDAARARVAQARAGIEGTVDQIRVEVTRTHRELVEALAAVRLYDARLLPAARAQVDAALAGFTTGQNDFPAVIQAERGLRDLELAAVRAHAEAWRRQAALDRAAGRISGGAS